jgi:hypothetical protein
MKGLAIADDHFCIVLGEDGKTELLSLPRLNDCQVEHIFQVAERLPDGVCLLVQRHSGRVKIFDVEKASVADGRKLAIAERSAAPDVINRDANEVPQPEHLQRELCTASPEVFDNDVLLIGHGCRAFLGHCLTAK